MSASSPTNAPDSGRETPIEIVGDSISHGSSGD